MIDLSLRWQVVEGDCLDVMRSLPDGCVDAVVTDPPYGLAFMGKRWDYDVPSQDIWAEALRVLKPGGHLLAFAGTRTQHRMAVRIEDAGFEIRDMIAWVYGSGFPKSLDVSKAIDKAAGAEREVVGTRKVTDSDLGQSSGWNPLDTSSGVYNYTAPATDAAKEWHGWGTALKPALEPITVARKPLIGTVAANVLAHGTGALNVDGCRVGLADWGSRPPRTPNAILGGGRGTNLTESEAPEGTSRWPANLIHDGSEEVVGLFPVTTQASWRKAQPDRAYPDAIFPQPAKDRSERGHNDSGSAARFFYCAKASKADRDAGVAGVAGVGALRDGGRLSSPRMNHHPTVKPTDLMRYLCRLVTPPNGIVLDPFTGSGSTGKAAMLEGFRFLGIEREAAYAEIARKRIAHVATQPTLFDTEAA